MKRGRTPSLSGTWDAIRGSPIDESSISKDEKQRVSRLSMDEMAKDSGQRIRRYSMDEKVLERERSRKMSVSSYITDGRVRRLSSMCSGSDDKDLGDVRNRRRTETLSLNLDIEKIIHSPSDAANSSLFVPQQTQRESGSSIISMREPKRNTNEGPNIQFENSYRMDVSEEIDQCFIKHLMYTILSDKFKNMTYSNESEVMGEHLKTATDSIKNVVKSLHLHRHKIVANVTIAQNNGQGLIVSSRCLSSQNNDIWIDATFRNPTMIVHGTVYLMYFE